MIITLLRRYCLNFVNRTKSLTHNNFIISIKCKLLLLKGINEMHVHKLLEKFKELKTSTDLIDS